jgi:pyruvate ferredoxin oxidoreductase gamma subunit
MYRIRFHGRGGQGMKTASRVLGSAFFCAGFEVQDAPRYGAERRGAPIFAFVRAARQPINERGIIRCPDLVIVADDSLPGVPAAGVLAGMDQHSVLLINTHEDLQLWRGRLNLSGPLLVLPAPAATVDPAALPYVGTACAAAAARLSGVIERDCLITALREELAALPTPVIEDNLAEAQRAWETMAPHQGLVTERDEPGARDYTPPAWVDLPVESARRAVPAIHAAATSVEVRTGLWRTMRPVIDYARCNRCWWVCSTFCPDGAISVEPEGTPVIDYDHCKGCLVCVAKCPPHAIEAIPEHQAQEQEAVP